MCSTSVVCCRCALPVLYMCSTSVLCYRCALPVLYVVDVLYQCCMCAVPVLCVIDVLYQSPAGAMLSQVIHALLLLPVYVIRPLLHALLSLLPHLDRLNRLLPASSTIEGEELELSDPLPGTESEIFICFKDAVYLLLCFSPYVI